MTDYQCSSCKYISYLKTNVERHITVKGCVRAEIVEINSVIICDYCKKPFSSRPNLTRHIKTSCKFKDSIKDQEILRLKMELELSRNSIKPVSINFNTINNNTNNNMGTQNTYITNNYNDTSLSKISDATYNSIIKDADESYMIIPTFTKHVHFDPNKPENHNIYMSNKGKYNKHLYVRMNNTWEIADKDSEINNLIYDKETNLSDWLKKNGNKYKEAKQIFNDYIERKYTDPDIAKEVKSGIEMLLYNGKNIINKNLKPL